MMSLFEDRLWDELKDEAENPARAHEAVPFPALRRRRSVTGPRVGAVLVAAVAVGVGLAVVPGGGGSTPAYAVESQQGGEVKISIFETSHLTREKTLAFQAELREAGVTVVDDATSPYNCRRNAGSDSSEPATFVVKPKTQVVGPGGGVWGIVWGTVKGTPGTKYPKMSDMVIILHKGDTAFFNVTYTEEKDSIAFDLKFLEASCIPASGS